MPKKQWISASEAAKRLKTSRYNVYRYVAEGALKSKSFERSVKIDADSVARFEPPRIGRPLGSKNKHPGDGRNNMNPVKRHRPDSHDLLEAHDPAHAGEARTESGDSRTSSAIIPTATASILISPDRPSLDDLMGPRNAPADTPSVRMTFLWERPNRHRISVEYGSIDAFKLDMIRSNLVALLEAQMEREHGAGRQHGPPEEGR